MFLMTEVSSFINFVGYISKKDFPNFPRSFICIYIVNKKLCKVEMSSFNLIGGS